MENVRTRNWFITINPESHCYNDVKQIIANQKVLNYAYIYHKAENDSENDMHIHLCIELENPRTFTAMQEMFKGAHIETMKYKNVSYQYLIHKNDIDKIQYQIDDIICSSREYVETMINNDEYKYLDTNTLIDEIESGNNTIKGLCRTFGLNQVNHKLGIIKGLINETESFTSQEILQHNCEELLAENSKLSARNEELEKQYQQLLKDYSQLKKDYQQQLPF